MDEISLIGLTRKYPEFKYSTNDLLDKFDKKFSELVKENILQLGVKERYCIRPIENYLEPTKNRINQNGDEPISDLAAETAKECLKSLGYSLRDITCLVAASENSDYQSPGLSSILLTKIGFSNFLPHFNIQGMACSTLPKLLELGKNMIKNDTDKILFVISGANSPWYLPHLGEDVQVVNPKESKGTELEKKKDIQKWVSTMFSFLFGDGMCAFVMTKKDIDNSIKIKKITHAVNFSSDDYRKASVKLVGNEKDVGYEFELNAGGDILDRALNYSKKVLMHSLNKDWSTYDKTICENYMEEKNKVMIHTGSLKILKGFQNLYNLSNDQISEGFETLQNYGNLTGVSIPTILDKSIKNGFSGKGLLIGITMGFGLDLVEIEK